MKISAPQAFVGLALLVGLCWAAIEFLLWTPEPSISGQACRITDLESLKGTTALRFVGDSLYTYNELEHKLVAYARPLDGTRELRKLAERDLYCKTPSYQCLNAPNPKELPELELSPATDSVRFLTRFKSQPSVIFPMRIQNEALQLAPPIGLCKSDGAPTLSEFFWLKSRLGYFDSETNRLSLWNIALYPGTPTLAAAREPDEVWSFEVNKGFTRSSCEAASAQKIESRSYALMRVPDRSPTSEMIEFISDTPVGSMLWSLNEEHPTLAVSQPIQGLKVQQAFRAKDKNLYVVSGNPATLFRLKPIEGGMEAGPAVLAPFATGASSISLSDDGDAALIRQGRKWFTAPKNYLVTKEQTASVLDENLQLTRNSVTGEILLGTSPRYHWLRPESDGLHLREINCGSQN